MFTFPPAPHSEAANPSASFHPTHRRLHSLPAIPGVWTAQAGRTAADLPARASTGYAALDAELPARGWPAGLVELLSDQPGLTDATLLAPMWRLSGPAEKASAPRSTRAEPWVAWVVPDRLAWVPHAPGWQHLGLELSHLLWVRTSSAADAVWTIEQMLRGPAVRGVVWVAQQASPLQLRRIHWAGRSAGVTVFAARPLAARADPSPAPLRLVLRPCTRNVPQRSPGPQGLEVEILKRQGPQMEAPLYLPHPMLLHLMPSASSPTPPIPRPEHRAKEMHDAVDRPAPAEAAS